MERSVTRSLTAVTLCLAVLAIGRPLTGQSTEPSRMLADPAISVEHLAFTYDGDLWIADRDGGHPRRLTTHHGTEGRPHFSPDGTWLAFTGEYDGNPDVYVVPVEGGAPRRLTWHPASDVVQGWTPDGEHVAFRSNRRGLDAAPAVPMTVAISDGVIEPLEVPFSHDFTLSPDGSRMAYSPAPPAMQQWKNYRGGRASRIWIANRSDLSVTEVSQPEGRANDLRPMWVGDVLYFLSDRNGEFNLFRQTGSEVEQITRHEDFPILAASAGADGAIVYEQAGYLHTYDSSTGQSERLAVRVTTDLVETRARWVDGDDFIQTFDISPHGERALFEARGEIVTVPAEEGDVRTLTETSGVHERSPVWSPDGSRIAFFSDATGEYTLHVAPATALHQSRSYPIDGTGFYDDPKWSPDGSFVSFTDNGLALHVLNVESGSSRRVGAQPVFSPVDNINHAWSPDSQWLAYTFDDASSFGQLYAYSVESETSQHIETGLGHISEPVFDHSGAYLYFFASTDAGPVQSWFDMSNQDTEMRGTLYLAVLDPTAPSPLAPRSDEAGEGDDSGDTDANEQEEGGQEPTVDFGELADRIVPLGVGPGWFSALEPGVDGQVVYLRSERVDANGDPGTQSLRMYDVGSREETTLLEAVDDFTLSADGAKLLIRRGTAWHIAAVGPVEVAESLIATGDIRIHVEPRAEWAQMLREIWRQQRDWFYDPDMHGADWNRTWDKYVAFLPDLATRGDLNRVTQWMLSELAVGHSRGGGGDFLRDAETVRSGLLGADYEIANGRWRFARVYRGENWNPELRAPLAEPGMNVTDGEYLLAVGGTQLNAPENPYAPFEGTAGKQVSITVGPNPDGSGSRTLTVVPVPDENNLRRRSWIDQNARRVREATDGRVAYVWVPNTTFQGWEAFKRYFFPQSGAEAVIIDERFNGGGQLPDYVIDLLDREYASSWAMRYGDDLHVPQASIQGPKIMLVNEYAGSGGDYMPWLFRQREIGTLIGKRTWGGLVGILGTPPTLDGATWTAPNLGFWTEEEGFGIENVGIPPDIDVEQSPSAVAAGGDPQLERGIEEVLRQLEANPVARPVRPPFPTRVRRGG